MSVTFDVCVDQFGRNETLDQKWLQLAKANINEEESKRLDDR